MERKFLDAIVKERPITMAYSTMNPVEWPVCLHSSTRIRLADTAFLHICSIRRDIANSRFISRLLDGRLTPMFDLLERYVSVTPRTRVLICRFSDADLTLVYDLDERHLNVITCLNVYVDYWRCENKSRRSPLEESILLDVESLHQHHKYLLNRLSITPEQKVQIHVLWGTSQTTNTYSRLLSALKGILKLGHQPSIIQAMEDV
jgi:hypothetical protein